MRHGTANMSIRIPIEEPSQAAEARRVALSLARECQFDESRAGRIPIVVMEACTNILKYAHRGEILIQIVESGSGRPDLEVIALDKGPGIPNIDECLQDGFTTDTSLGHGLGAIRRLSDESDFYSVPGEGTAVLARWAVVGVPKTFSAPARLIVGSVNVSKPGEEFCGDAFGIEQTDSEAAVLLADGLGHGFEAGQSSQEAVRMLREHPQLAPAALIDLTHKALRSHRGAAVSIARIDLNRGTLHFAGLGNVSGQIYSIAGRGQHLISVNGTAGHNAARIRQFSYPWPQDGILVMHSDGLATGTSLDAKPALARRDPSLIAGVLYRDFCRGHDDATVVVARAA